jgi:LPXTG-motif cell wall-anchored protein
LFAENSSSGTEGSGTTTKKVLICLASIDTSGLTEEGIDYILTYTDKGECADILKTLRSVDCTVVKVEDILSDYAEWSTGLSLQLTVTDAAGTRVQYAEIDPASNAAGSTNGENASTGADTPTDGSTPAVTTVAQVSAKMDENNAVTASYVVSGEDRKIVLQFPEGYHLPDQYTFSVTAGIEPTEAAYQYYIENGSYEKDASNNLVVGDLHTGESSASKTGFNVNKDATVSYAIGGAAQTSATYEKPVIQLQTVYNWSLFKVSATDKTIKLSDAQFTLTPVDGTANLTTYYGKSGTDGEVTWYTDSNYSEDNQVTILQPGTYTLTETQAPSGYSCSDVNWTVVVDYKNGITITREVAAADGATAETIAMEAESDFSPDNNKVTIQTDEYSFQNEVAYSLPSAGGTGIFLFVVAGMLLMMGGALLIFAKRRRVRRI